MQKRLAVLIGVALASGCAPRVSPLDRAKAQCREFGDTSAACVERRFDIERTRDEQRYSGRPQPPGTPAPSGASPANSGGAEDAANAPTAPRESEFDRMRREMKENCLERGGKWMPDLTGGGASCELSPQ